MLPPIIPLFLPCVIPRPYRRKGAIRGLVRLACYVSIVRAVDVFKSLPYPDSTNPDAGRDSVMWAIADLAETLGTILPRWSYPKRYSLACKWVVSYI